MGLLKLHSKWDGHTFSQDAWLAPLDTWLKYLQMKYAVNSPKKFLQEKFRIYNWFPVFQFIGLILTSMDKWLQSSKPAAHDKDQY